MRIGEFAAQGECAAQTVRFYEREGLLEPPQREVSGYRSYTDADLARLRFIRHCRSLDIPLPEVRRLLGFADAPARSCEQVDSLLDKHIGQVQQRLRALSALERQLVALRRRCRGDRNKVCAILESFMHATQEPDMTVTVADLQAFADAWNRHDVEALMRFMTDDCVFEASSGLDVWGTRSVGRNEVQAAFGEVWGTFPDAQWRSPRHFVCGDRGVSEWTFTGTREDGTRFEVNGCDVFTFRDGKIALKNSYRKNRPPLPAG